MQLELAVIRHQVDAHLVPQRAEDGYVDASAMCKAVGKKFTDYEKQSVTREFMTELADRIGIQEEKLVQKISDGFQMEVWVHPDVAINLGQWCSPKFAVAVSQWIRNWIEEKGKKVRFPYHLDRYMANRQKIPHTHFSMLNEIVLHLIGPMESQGYILPEKLIPDISEGKMFCKWLRDERKIDTDSLPTYQHKYADGRIVDAKLYPNELLAAFRKHFHEVWLPNRANDYFTQKDPSALPYLQKLLPAPKKV
jgi:hypothetical protein